MVAAGWETGIRQLQSTYTAADTHTPRHPRAVKGLCAAEAHTPAPTAGNGAAGSAVAPNDI